MMIASAVVVATVLVALGLVAASAPRLDRRRAVACTLTGIALLLVTLGHRATASSADGYLAEVSVPVVIAASAVAMAGWRPLTAMAALGAVLAGPVRLLFFDPFHDPSCTSACEANPMSLWPQAGIALAALTTGFAVLVVALLLHTARGERGLSAAVGGVVAALVWSGAEVWWVIVPAAIAGVVCAVDLNAELGRRGRLLAVIEAMAWEGDAEDALRTIAPSAAVAYRVAGEDPLVDRHGQPRGYADDAVDVIGPDGLIAQLQNLGTVTSLRTVADLINGPARLGLENLRLAAESSVRAREIAASTRRLVEKSDAERRRLERDLHDGAQQGLVSLGIQLRRDASAAGLDTAVVDRVVAGLQEVAGEIRDIAHGIHAAAVDDDGLLHALRLLANRTPTPLNVVTAPDRPISPSLAAAVYAAVEEVCMMADGPVEVTVVDGEDGIATTIITDLSLDHGPDDLVGTAGDQVPLRSADRFRALGGHLSVRSTQAGDLVTGALPWRPL